MIIVRNMAVAAAALALGSCARGAAPPARNSADTATIPSPAKVSSAAVIATAGPGPKGVETADLNKSVDPCTDFFEFANGTWRAQNPIPPSMSKWGRRVAAHEAHKEQLRTILAEVAAKTDWPNGSTEQLLGDYYSSCMDEASVDAAGISPVSPLLAEIAGIRTEADLQRVIRRLHELAVAVPFGTTADTAHNEPFSTITHVTAGTLGLPDRDYYLKSDPASKAGRERYREHISTVLALAGMPKDRASGAAEMVLTLERHLAEASLDSASAGEPALTDHKMTFAELQKISPHIDWEHYFAEAKMPRGEVNVAEPKLLREVDKQLQQTPLAAWKAYLEFQLLESASPWLSTPFALESFNFKDKYLGGAKEPKPRGLFCTESAEALLSDALAKKYVERHFSPEAKAKVERMIQTMLSVLKDEVNDLPWMASETKTKALEKLAAYNPQVGYPAKWKDYSALGIRRGPLFGNVALARRFNVDDVRARAGKPTDKGLWIAPSVLPDPYIVPELHEIVLPAGYLQPPAFSLEATDAVNYGALGVAVAHDITHTIDALGRELDVMGRPQNWWTEGDTRAFQKLGQCVSDQFEGYFIEPGIHHQGKLVESESIGDLAGVRIAYQALKRSAASQPVPVRDGFTAEQQFFIAWGQFRGDAISPESQRQMVKQDIHPVSKFRVNGPLSNSPEFESAFSCKAGAEMVRPKEKRCTVW